MVDAEEKRYLKAFYSEDPVAGEEAVHFFGQQHADRALEIVVPLGSFWVSLGVQTEIRLRKLTKNCGESAIGYLLRVLEHGQTQSKQIAARCFAGLDEDSRVAEEELFRLSQLANYSSFHTQQAAITAQGFGGFVSYASTFVETALYGSIAARNALFIDHDFAKNLSYFAVQALIRSTGRMRDTDAIENFLGGVADIFERAPKESAGISDWDIRLVSHHLNQRAADPLLNNWVGSEDPRLRRMGPEALGKLQLERMIGPLVETLFVLPADTERQHAAGLALCEYTTRRSVDQIAAKLAEPNMRNLPAFDWWFSTLYPLSAKWGSAIDTAIEVARLSTEPGAQMRYSLAICGAGEHEELKMRLEDSDSFTRGTAALALVRGLGEAAAPILYRRDRETSSPFEHVAMLASQIHAGMLEQSGALHEALKVLPSFSLVRRMWKREILSAFYVAEGKESKRWRLWCEAAHACPKEVINEMHSLLGNAFSPTADETDPPVTLSEEASAYMGPITALKAADDAMTNLPIIVLITVNDHETDAVFDEFLGPTKSAKIETRNGVDYSRLGVHGEHEVVHTICEMGASGIGASQQRTQQAITQWQPRAVIAVGIAFGLDESRQKIGDVLISKQLQDYELGRVNADGSVTPRGDKASCGYALLNRLRTTDSHQRRSTPDWPKIRFGLMLSGQKLVDNLDYRMSLQKLAGGEALGGEMEGGGLYTSAQAEKVDWVVIKAICDWGYQKNMAEKDAWQKLAATNAARVVKIALHAGRIY